MKPALAFFQLFALIGFALSLVVHVFSIFGVRAFSGAETLHIGIFIVFAPAILVNNGTFRRVRMNPKEVWMVLLRGCMPWMITLTKALFGYAILNFGYFIFFVAAYLPRGTGSEMSPEVLRGFSGHWLVFYWISFALLYSRANFCGPQIPNCLSCKSDVSLFDKFCPNCGVKLSSKSSC